MNTSEPAFDRFVAELYRSGLSVPPEGIRAWALPCPQAPFPFAGALSGRGAVVIGAGHALGRVAAALDWQGPSRRRRVAGGVRGGGEDVFPRTGTPRFWRLLGGNPALRRLTMTGVTLVPSLDLIKPRLTQWRATPGPAPTSTAHSAPDRYRCAAP